jgi:hypothetical protein
MNRPAYDNALPIARREVSNLVEQFDTPLYPPLLDAEGNLAATVTVRQGTAAELDLIVLAAGELAIEVDGGGAPVRIRMGDGETEGGIQASGGAFQFDGLTTIAASNSVLDVEFVMDDINSRIVVTSNDYENSATIQFPSPEDASYSYEMPAVTGVVAVIHVKATTGDYSEFFPGIVVNTFDNNIKLFADGAWRTLASW